MTENDEHDEQRRRSHGGNGEPEDQPQEPGAEGGSQSPAADSLPGAPADDSSDVGDTDQHSSA
jgi:hypothetical protein